MKESSTVITGIGHVAFVISDLEQSLDFYCNKLGFRQAFILDREGTPSPWIVYIQIAPGHFIELFPGGSGENERRPLGFNQFFLVVEGLPPRQKGLKMGRAPAELP